MPVGVRRSDIEIIRDILSMEVGRLTELRYAANLSHVQLQRYLTFLEQRDLLSLNRKSAKVVSFEVTDKGKSVLEMLDRLFTVLGIEYRSEIGI